MWLALTEMHMHGTRERLMQQENFGQPKNNSYCGRRKLVKS